MRALFPTNRRLQWTPLGLVLLCLLYLVQAVPARAVTVQPINTVFAGSLSAVSLDLVNGVPATQTALRNAFDVAVLSTGDKVIADSDHNQIRRVDSQGVFHVALGSGVAGCQFGTIPGQLSGVPVGDVQLYQPKGVTSDGNGGFFASNTMCGTIIHVDSAGFADLFAGHLGDGFYTRTIDPGMPATSAYLNQPAGSSYDKASKTLYVADQFSSRVLKIVGGRIWVVAGTSYASNGFNGDGLVATDAMLNYPTDVTYLAASGTLAIADTSNGLVRAVTPLGTLVTLQSTVGTGQPPSGLGQDANGNLFASYVHGGLIQKISLDGVSTVVDSGLGDNVYGLDISPSGDGYVAELTLVIMAQGLVPTPVIVPPVTVPPAITALTIRAAMPTDRLLRRGLTIEALDNGTPVDHYDYGWAPTVFDTSPTTQVQTSKTVDATLFYGNVTPDTDWYLLARAVAADDTPGAWSSPKLVHTPPIPVLIFCCDSITSGHHNDYGDGGKTTCEDPNYGYASIFAKRWLAVVPPAWRGPNQVANVAVSGFAMDDHIKGSYISGTVLRGGKDACKTLISGIPINDAAAKLTGHAGSWSRIIATGGINGTNWTPVIKNLVITNLTIEEATGKPITATQCNGYVSTNWDGSSLAVSTSITSGVNSLITKLRLVDPSLRVTWIGYYNAAGTGTNSLHSEPYVPLSCSSAFEWALNKVHAAIKGALPVDAEFIETRPTMNLNGSRIQPLMVLSQLTKDNKNPPGWPHPNNAGSSMIAELLAP